MSHGSQNYDLLAPSAVSIGQPTGTVCGTGLCGLSCLQDGGIPLQNSTTLQPDPRTELGPEILAPFPPCVSPRSLLWGSNFWFPAFFCCFCSRLQWGSKICTDKYLAKYQLPNSVKISWADEKAPRFSKVVPLARALLSWFLEVVPLACALLDWVSKVMFLARAFSPQRCACPWPVPLFQKFTKHSVQTGSLLSDNTKNHVSRWAGGFCRDEMGLVTFWDFDNDFCDVFWDLDKIWNRFDP